jgi:hypothetical protein
MHGSVLKRNIAWTEIHELFVAISDEFGYTAEEYSFEITELVDTWTQQGYIEIYESVEHRQYGRAKDSSLSPGTSPYYIGLFHVRLLRGENDPLVVLVFDDKDGDTVASLRFMLDHNDMFGVDRSEKFNPQRMKEIRKKIDDFIKKGNE